MGEEGAPFQLKPCPHKASCDRCAAVFGADGEPPPRAAALERAEPEGEADFGPLELFVSWLERLGGESEQKCKIKELVVGSGYRVPAERRGELLFLVEAYAGVFPFSLLYPALAWELRGNS